MTLKLKPAVPHLGDLDDESGLSLELLKDEAASLGHSIVLARHKEGERLVLGGGDLNVGSSAAVDLRTDAGRC